MLTKSRAHKKIQRFFWELGISLAQFPFSKAPLNISGEKKTNKKTENRAIWN